MSERESLLDARAQALIDGLCNNRKRYYETFAPKLLRLVAEHLDDCLAIVTHEGPGFSHEEDRRRALRAALGDFREAFLSLVGGGAPDTGTAAADTYEGTVTSRPSPSAASPERGE